MWAALAVGGSFIGPPVLLAVGCWQVWRQVVQVVGAGGSIETARLIRAGPVRSAAAGAFCCGRCVLLRPVVPVAAASRAAGAGGGRGR